MTDDGQRPPTALGSVLAEIDEEAGRQRASGRLPPHYEEDLRAAFAALTPGAGGGESLLHQSLEVVEQRARFDARPPVASSKAAGTLVKQVIGKEVGWYVRFVVDQVGHFATAVVRALGVVEDDLAQLRERVGALRPDLPDDVDVPGTTSRWWIDEARAALTGAPGPVLYSGTMGVDNADSAAGEVLDILGELGLGLSGPKWSAAGTDTGATQGRRARASGVVEELESTPDGALGAMVLEGPVQWLTAAECDRLVALAARRLAPGGVVVAASSTPEAWARAGPPVVVDLAPGRPLHPETWAYLFEHHGFASTSVFRGGRDLRRRLDAVAPDAASGEGPSAHLVTALRDLLAGPDEYLVVAVRGR